MKKLLSTLLIMVMCMGIIPNTASAAVKINKSKATMEVDSTLTLKISGTDNKISWSSNKKSVATVSNKGTVTAIKSGNATITATVGGNKYSCSVKVVNSNKKATELELTEGDYIVGKDIPSGRYNLKCIDGNGCIYVYNNENIFDKTFRICDKENFKPSEHPTMTFNNLNLKNKQKLSIVGIDGGTMKIQFSCPVNVLDSNKKVTEFELTKGDYIVGEDIPSGNYNLKGIDGWGFLYIYGKPGENYEQSAYLVDGKKFKPSRDYTVTYNNYNLKDKQVLGVDGPIKVQFKSK